MYLNDKTDILHVHSSVYPFILRDYITKINLAFVDFKGLLYPYLGFPCCVHDKYNLDGLLLYVPKISNSFFKYFIGNTTCNRTISTNIHISV